MSDYRAIVIGGGILGTSLLYHLTEQGWSDVLLLEKGELTSGSTWHAAGQITHATSSYGLANMTKYGVKKYAELETETGQSVSWHAPGSLRLAYNDEEHDWLRYIVSVGRGVGNRMEIVGPGRIAELNPFYNLDGVQVALHTPDDGHLDPAGAAFAFAAGAKSRGASIRRNTRVTNTIRLDDGTWRVETETGSYGGEVIVNAAGTYARQVGEWAGLEVPITPITHHYFVTEEVPEFRELGHELPVMRDDSVVSGYLRMERHAGLFGVYEKADPNSVWEEGTPWEADHFLFPPDYDRIGEWLEAAFERMPVLAGVGIQKAIHGAICHTPDGGMLLGPAPGHDNYWLCAGAAVGIAWGPGGTRYLADWMVNGHTVLNLRGFDPRRFGDFATAKYNRTKAREDYLLRHEIPYPGLNRTAGRPFRAVGVYDRLQERGAVFEEVFGWERPRWFAPTGWPREDIHSFRRADWYKPVAEEVANVRNNVGVADLSAFAKLEVSGPDAAAFLNRVSAGRIPKVGRIGLMYMLSPHGMVEIEFTAARLSEIDFYLVGAAVGEVRFEDWLAYHVDDEDVVIRNVSQELGVLSIAGPNSRRLLSKCTEARLDNDAFGWLSVKEIAVAGIPVRALRLSFTGEMGWELHLPLSTATHVLDSLLQAGDELGVGLFGSHALNSMRMEVGYKVSGDMTNECSPYEAGLMRFVTVAKEGFIGREALLANMDAPRWMLAHLEVDSGDLDADCLGGEGVFSGDRRVGVVTTAGYGFTTEKSLAWAYVGPDHSEPGTRLSVSVLGRSVPAVVLGEPVWDPKSERPRG